MQTYQSKGTTEYNAMSIACMHLMPTAAEPQNPLQKTSADHDSNAAAFGMLMNYALTFVK